MCAASVRGTYPRCLARVALSPCRCLRRDVNGPIHRSPWQRPAPGGERNGSIDGGSGERNPLLAQSRSSEHAGDRPHCGLKVRWRGTGNGPSWKPKRCALGNRNRRRGCRKAAKGPEQGLREPDGVPREAQPAPPGPGGTGPRVADEAPAYPSHLRPIRRRRTARGRARRPTSRMSISQTRPSLSAFDAAPRLTSGRRTLRRRSRTRA